MQGDAGKVIPEKQQLTDQCSHTGTRITLPLDQRMPQSGFNSTLGRSRFHPLDLSLIQCLSTEPLGCKVKDREESRVWDGQCRGRTGKRSLGPSEAMADLLAAGYRCAGCR